MSFKTIFLSVFAFATVFAQANKAPSLKGTPGRHQAETQKADSDDLSRIKDQAELDRFVAQGLLVRMPENESIEIDKKIPSNRRYCKCPVGNLGAFYLTIDLISGNC